MKKPVPIQPGFVPLFPVFILPGNLDDKTRKIGGGRPQYQGTRGGVAVSLRGVRPTALGVIQK